MEHIELDLPAAGPRPSVLGIITCAMEEEAVPLFDYSKSGGKIQYLGVGSLQLLQIEDAAVALLTTGIGLVNASMSLTQALSLISPRYIFSCGSAGGLSTDAKIGDVVAARTYRYSGADVRAFGYELGQVPKMPPYFQADSELLDRFGKLNPELTPGCHLRFGEIISSDYFVTPERVPTMRADFPNATTVDMESTALAHVSANAGVPFLSIRGISDLCGPEAASENYLEGGNVSEGSLRAALAIMGLIG